MKSFFLFLLACGLAFGSQAQSSLHPVPSKGAVDSLKTQLWQSAPGTIARLTVLLKLSNSLLDRHDTFQDQLDSADFYSKQANVLSEHLPDTPGKIKSLQLLGRLSTAKQLPAQARQFLNESIHLSQQHGEKRLEALAWSYLALTYTSTAENVPLIKNYIQRARVLYQQLGDKMEEAFRLEDTAGESIIEGNHAQALRELKQAAALYRAAGCKNLQYIYANLLYVNDKLGNYQEALRYGFEAIENARAMHDTLYIGDNYGRIGNVYGQLNQPREALAYYRKSFRTYEQQNRKVDAINAMGRIAGVLIAQKQPQQALDGLLGAIKRASYDVAAENNPQVFYYLARGYLAVKSVSKAEKYYLLMLAALEQTNDVQKLYAYFSIGEFYLLTKNYDKVRFYITKSLVLASRVGAQTRIVEAHRILFKADSAQGRYTEAIAHFQKYKALNDSLFSEAKNKQIAQIQIQYDTKKKEQNIALLTEQNQRQQAGLRQRELQRNATLGGAVLLSLLLGVSYNRARLKKRSTHLLEQKQLEINQKNQALEQVLGEKEGLLLEKEWMLKEIHHRVKNNLQIVSELLDSQIDQLQEPRTLAIIRESQNRVQAMALVHQKLYQSQNLARVDMPEYIREIVEHLFTSFHCESVQEHFDVAPVELDVALATPLGLIINEAVTNSLKYAFPDARPGTISIRLMQLPGERYQLTLADNGIGLPAGFNLSASRSMGLTLITGLSEQIEADLTFLPTQGVCICLEFEGRKAALSEAIPA
jgi:two-component sensor histidine kinase